jgi:hypothetical protein
MKKSVVTPSFLKQIAKKLKKEKSLSHSRALDEAAGLYGYSNYKHYLNDSKISLEESRNLKKSLLSEIFLEKDISKKVNLAISFIEKFKTSFQDSLSILKQFEQSENALKLMCEKLGLKDDIQKSLLNYFIESKDDLQALPMKEHFVAKEILVEDLEYEISDDVLRVDGNYVLSFKFEHEVPEEMKDMPHFNPQPMFGEFIMTIDKNKKIAIEEPSIGEEIDGQIFMGSFKLGRF